MDIAMKPTLLIADDNPGVRRVLVQMLSALGMKVEAAEDGAQALESARSLQPDLIILDVRMPGRDGYQVCEELRRDASTRAIPILMLTGLGGMEDQLSGLQHGADDYVSKPFRFDELRARVTALLRRNER